MGLLGVIGSAISGAVSAITGAIGGAAGGLASGIVSILGPSMDIKLAIEMVAVIAKAIVIIAEELGILEKDVDVEELGAKASQPDTKKSTDFESAEAYIEYLKNEVKLDQERFQGLSEEEKLACQAAGLSILTKGVEARMGMEIPAEFLRIIGQQGMTPQEVKAFMESFKENNFDTMKAMADYLSGKNMGESSSTVNQAMADAVRVTNPGATEDEIQDKIADMCAESRK